VAATLYWRSVTSPQVIQVARNTADRQILAGEGNVAPLKMIDMGSFPYKSLSLDVSLRDIMPRWTSET
jgi:hypothetical protein